MTLFWFRRDLRLEDNAGLYRALRQKKNVQPIFIFDKEILDKLEDKDDARITFIHQEINRINNELAESGASILTFYDSPLPIFKKLADEYDIESVYTNHDYEPYAKERDQTIGDFLESKNIAFKSYKDQVIFEKDEVLKDDGDPYVVYTPYSKKWKEKLNDFYVKSYPTSSYFSNLRRHKEKNILDLEEMGFEKSDQEFPDKKYDQELVKDYDETRDIPSIRGTSRLSLHLRFGTVSIRNLVRHAQKDNQVWLNELIWREFYMQILWHFPHVVDTSFRQKYDQIEWMNDEENFQKWCDGKTGYPIVDAGMRELNQTGFMHNRVRMIVASFLTKHLLIDWRWGEAYFGRKLLDYELASNNGGWQWAAGTGVDAAPYFRIFNPYTQTDKFDPDFKYIKKWVPEYDDEKKYPEAIVEHKEARERALETYKRGLN